MLTSTIAACALYILSAKQDCYADYMRAKAYCTYDRAWATEFADEYGDTDYKACVNEARTTWKDCRAEVTPEMVCP